MFTPNFLRFSDFTTVSSAPMEDMKGNQHAGFVFLRFSDGSAGLVKVLKDWHGNKTGRLYPAELLAAQEYLAARVGEVMDAPIRDCVLLNSRTVMMPYIEGKSGEELDKDGFPCDQRGISLRLFDHLTANADRRAKNVMFTPDGNFIGIDHALCNFRLRTKMLPEKLADLWNGGVSVESLALLRPKLEALLPEFALLGMVEQHENIIATLDNLAAAFAVLAVASNLIEKASDPALVAQADGKAAEAWDMRRREHWESAGYAHSKAADLYRHAASTASGSDVASLTAKANAQDELSREAHFTDTMTEQHSPAELSLAEAVAKEVARVAQAFRNA